MPLALGASAAWPAVSYFSVLYESKEKEVLFLIFCLSSNFLFFTGILYLPPCFLVYLW